MAAVSDLLIKNKLCSDWVLGIIALELVIYGLDLSFLGILIKQGKC